MEERDERGMGRMECVTQEEEYEEEEEEEQSPRALRWARLFGARVGAPTRPESEQQALSRPQKNRCRSQPLISSYCIMATISSYVLSDLPIDV